MSDTYEESPEETMERLWDSSDDLREAVYEALEEDECPQDEDYEMDDDADDEESVNYRDWQRGYETDEEDEDY